MASLTILSTTALSHTSFMSSPVLHTALTSRRPGAVGFLVDVARPAHRRHALDGGLQTREVPSPDEALQHRLVEAATARGGEVGVLEELGHGQVRQEAARARRAEGDSWHAELLRYVDGERQHAVGDDARSAAGSSRTSW
jgi:hypothetical protein